ncbi:MAG: hypothetical protein KGD73_13665 [Candidatus Lokiarchaeota archaeon]|nr:hypothetical protein [Candidatus Lokiarchaeota archaeon]
MSENDDLWREIPGTAYVSLARRGMEKLSLDQCFLNNCDNEDINLLEPFKKEEFEDEKKLTKLIHIKCHKCERTFILKLETLKAVAKSNDSDDQALTMGLIYALDEKGKNIGHIGFF